MIKLLYYLLKSNGMTKKKIITKQYKVLKVFQDTGVESVQDKNQFIKISSPITKKKCYKNNKTEMVYDTNTSYDDISIEEYNNQLFQEHQHFPLPPEGFTYIPCNVLETILTFIKKNKYYIQEIDRFKNKFSDFLNNKNILYNNLIDWIEVDNFIQGYTQQLLEEEKIDKFIMEYGIVESVSLLIHYYHNDKYENIFKDEMEVFEMVKRNMEDNSIKVDTAMCILKTITGHKSYNEIIQ